MTRRDGREALEMRPLRVVPGYAEYAEGSALVELGQTRVLVAVSVTEGVPRHVPRRSGWLMAEYNLLPRATRNRTQRERFRLGGRTQEVQRLLGRAFRAVLDLKAVPGKTVVVDADVLQADGGTRVASLIGGYAALWQAFDRLVRRGEIDEWPLVPFAAVSLGWFGGESVFLDLTEAEDMGASADLTVVGTAEGEIIEVHGGGEGRPLPAEVFQRMVTVGLEKIPGIVSQVHRAMAGRALEQ